MRSVYGLLTVVFALSAGLASAAEGDVALVRGAECKAAWDEEARKRDPVGFVTNVHGQLQSDLQMLLERHEAIQAENGELVEAIHQQQRRLAKAERLADTFRFQYNRAERGNGFPVEICGRSYTEDQLLSQIRLTLAEVKGHKARIAKMQKVRDRAETTFEHLTIRIADTRACLEVLESEIELLKYRQLPIRGELLLAHVATIIDDNDGVRQGHPVGPLAVLYGNCNPRVKPSVSQRELRGFVDGEPGGNQRAMRYQTDNGGDRKGGRRQKPVFQQS